MSQKENCGNESTLVSSESLTPPRRRLFTLMRKIEFGQIKGLHVSGGDPLFNPKFIATKSVRMSDQMDSERNPSHSAYTLNREQRTFIDILDKLGDGKVDLIKIQYGKPIAVEIDVALE
jgi:hypothetical protein